MSVSTDDPRLTAYALGEMGAEERRAFEDELAGDAALLAEVKAIAALAKEMESELGRGAPIELGALRRDMITVAAKTEERARKKKRGSALRWATGAVAASLAIAAGALLFVSTPHRAAAPSMASEDREEARASAAAAAPKGAARIQERDRAPAAAATAEASSAPLGGSAPHGLVKACDPKDPLCTVEVERWGATASARASASASSAAPFASAPVPAAPPPRGIPPR